MPINICKFVGARLRHGLANRQLICCQNIDAKIPAARMRGQLDDFLLGIQQPTAALTITKQRIELQNLLAHRCRYRLRQLRRCKNSPCLAKINLTEFRNGCLCHHLSLLLRSGTIPQTLERLSSARIHLLALQFRITVAVFTAKELISVVPMELIILLIIVAVLAFWVASIYNRLVALQNRHENGFSQIEVQLKRRYDLIPNLVETAKAYMAHERETLEAVIAARNQAIAGLEAAAGNPGDANAMKELAGAEGVLQMRWGV
ncbi:MAG: hypothetical protein CM15mP120_26780 [Pseudomonadota bacterium]|nr:MAG: hypothetical protein CM15mP120_26780 [Pseudomonadota bacterium]